MNYPYPAPPVFYRDLNTVRRYTSLERANRDMEDKSRQGWNVVSVQTIVPGDFYVEYVVHYHKKARV